MTLLVFGHFLHVKCHDLAIKGEDLTIPFWQGDKQAPTCVFTESQKLCLWQQEVAGRVLVRQGVHGHSLLRAVFKQWGNNIR